MIPEATRRQPTRSALPRAAALAAAVAVLTAPVVATAQSHAHTDAPPATGTAPAAAPVEPAPAALPPAAPDVETLVALALDRTPSVAALRARLSSSREQVAPAGALPDPMVELMYQSVGAPWAPMAPMTMGRVEVSQPIPYPGKRRARREAADAEAEMRAAEIGELRARVAAEVRMAYARIYAIDREREAIDAAREFVELMSVAVTGRYVAGQADQEALAKIEIEKSRLGERRTDLEADRAMQVAILNRLADRPGDANLGPVARLPDVSLGTDALEATAIAGSPEVLVGRASIRAASRKLEAARIESKPNFLVGLGAGATSEPAPLVTVRFGVELPFWRSEKQEPLVRAAGYDVEAANLGLRAVEASIRAEAARIRAQWKRDTDQVARYREAILPQTKVALDAARAHYVAGHGDFSMVVEDFRLWLGARTEMAKREADRFSTWAEAQALTAGAPAGPRRGAAP